MDQGRCDVGQEPRHGQQELDRRQGDARHRRRRALIAPALQDGTALARGRRALVRQRSGDDCGPAALASVAAFLDVAVDHSALIDAAGISRGSTDLARLRLLAHQLGLQVSAVHADDHDLGGINRPAILHLRSRFGGGHFVVVTDGDQRRAVVIDPARGCRRYRWGVLRRRWSGYALEVSRVQAA